MKKQADPYQVAGRLIPELSEEVIDQATRWAIQHRRLKAMDAEKFKAQLRGGLEQNIDHDRIDDAQYHDSRSVGAPVQGGELAAMVGGNMAVGAGITALKNRSDRKKAILDGVPFKPESIRPGDILSRAFGPGAVIPTAAFETARIALNPMSDPLYRRGQRSYLSSVGKGFEGQMDSMRDREKETRGKYGPLGVPVQAFHGILNPITSIGYAARAGKDLVMGKQSALLARLSKAVINKALEA